MASEPLKWLQRLNQEAQAFFLEQDVVRGDPRTAHWTRRLAWFFLQAGKSFFRNRCPIRASALAYTTLLALVPMLAVAVGVSTSFLKTKEGEKQIHALVNHLVASVAPQLDLEVKADAGAAGADDAGEAGKGNRRERVAAQIFDYIRNIQSGTLGAAGMLALILVAISLLSTIEGTFNDIWGVNRGRSWVSRVVHYWAVITLGPLVVLLVVGVMSGEKYAATERWLAALPMVGRVGMAWGLRLLPYVLLSLAFWLFYLLMPNTKVRWTAALIGGVVGGCLWQMNNEFSVLYVSNVVTYSKMYGSLGILPVFLVGLYFSWLILLFGAQISYSFQNRHACLQTILGNQINQQGREFIALRLMAHIGGRYQDGEHALSRQVLAETLSVPSRLAGEILDQLVQAGLLLEVRGNEGGFVPARPLRQIGCVEVLRALRQGQGSEGLRGAEPTLIRVRREFERIGAAEREAANRATIQDLVEPKPSADSPAPASVSHV